ncbi:MAG: chromate efflux transporter [Phycisphaerae bacterium]|nr:chromate efflux transporter [Phycisphaerae bacterium]
MDHPAPAKPPSPAAPGRGGLSELALVFLRLGATAFGGPAVHVAMLEQEVVHRRKWLTHEKFLDLLGATNLIPGPNSTEMAIHIGLLRGGRRGLLVAGSCFIIPAFIITFACAWFYARYAQLPQLQGVLYGVKPVVLAIVVQALWRLGRTALKSPPAIGLAVAALAAGLLGVNELIVLLGAGVVAPLLRGGLALRGPRRPPTATMLLLPPLLPLGVTAPATSAAAGAFGLLPMFLFFLKVGAVLYGSGYVLLAFLRGDLVERWGWLTESQLLDAIAIGQVTPGPLFTTATFIGYVLGGPAGACLATAGIFLPAFVFVALSAPLLPRLRRSKTAGAFLDGVNAASLALMAAVTLQLLGSAFVDTLTVILGIAGAVILLASRVNPIWLVAGAGALGLALRV